MLFNASLIHTHNRLTRGVQSGSAEQLSPGDQRKLLAQWLRIPVLSLFAAGLTMVMPPLSPSGVALTPPPEHRLQKEQAREDIAKLDELIKKDLENPELYLQRGRACLRAEEYAKSRVDLDKAIELNPALADAYLARAEACEFMAVSKENTQCAMADYSKVIALKPGLAVAYLRRGGIYAYRLDQPETALKDFSTAIDLEPNNEEAYRARAYWYGKLGKQEQSIKDWDKIIGLAPNNASAHIARAREYTALGQYDKALADYNQSLEIDSSVVSQTVNPWSSGATALEGRGQVFTRMGQYRKAIADFDKIIAQGANNPTAYYHRGCARGKLKEYKLSADDFTKACELGLSTADVYRERASAYDALGKRVLADRDRKMMMSLKSSSR